MTEHDIKPLQDQAVELLKTLIRIPSVSGNEDDTATRLCEWLKACGIEPQRYKNNVWATNRYFAEHKPTILLVSHHDTVPPSGQYTSDPYEPVETDGLLYGLGANDAGGPLVTLLALFRYFYEQSAAGFNLVICLAAEEETSGRNGIEAALPYLPAIDFAVVGEPTGMQAAISERGLVVCDAYSYGKAGHAARNEGINAIEIAMRDIQWFSRYNFPGTSTRAEAVKMTVTQINAGTGHNVVPESCHFVVDVRTSGAYTNEEVVAVINQHTESEVIPRSCRLTSSALAEDHPFRHRLNAWQVTQFHSVTMSDQAMLRCPSVKWSPGESRRSHTADEYIARKEIEHGISFFIAFFEDLASDTAACRQLFYSRNTQQR